MKPLLVGSMPTRSTDQYWNRPMSGGVSKMLCRAMGLPELELFGRSYWALEERFEIINAIQRHGPWDIRQATSRLGNVIVSRHEVVVLFGRRVQKAYALMTSPASSSVAGADFFQWVVDPLSYTGRRQVAVLPDLHVIKGFDQHRRDQVGVFLNEAIEKAKQLEETRL